MGCSDALMREAGVPERFLRARLPDFHDRWPDGTMLPLDEGMFITGAVGTGKTHLAAALVAENIHLGPQWLNVPMFLASIRATFGNRATGSEYDHLMMAQGPQVLVLDDLGAERKTEYASSIICSVVDGRLAAGKPTVITTNVSLDDLNQRDPRLASRCAAMTYVKMGGDDRRMEGLGERTVSR